MRGYLGNQGRNRPNKGPRHGNRDGNRGNSNGNGNGGGRPDDMMHEPETFAAFRRGTSWPVLVVQYLMLGIARQRAVIVSRHF